MSKNPSVRARVYPCYADRWGYHIQNVTREGWTLIEAEAPTFPTADEAALAARAEVERVIAERDHRAQASFYVYAEVES